MNRAAAFKLLLSRRSPLALSLDFTSGTLDPRITFSRGTLGTRVDSTGKIAYGLNNRFTRSQQFDDAAWSKVNVSVTADALVAPDGTVTADLVTMTSTSVPFLTQSLATQAGQNCVTSVYAKQGTAAFLWIDFVINGADVRAWFNLATGAVGTVQAGLTAGSSSAGNGWFRFWVVGADTINETNTKGFGLSNADNSSTVTNGVTAYLWGAQLETVTYATTPGTYQPTTSTAYYGPRFGWDPVRLVGLGLLIEEARTNLSLQSGNTADATWNAGGGTTRTSTNNNDPAGGTNAALFTSNGVSTTHLATTGAAVAAVSGTIYASSIFVKAGTTSLVQLIVGGGINSSAYANFSLTGSGSVTASGGLGASGAIVAYPNGWYRVTLIWTGGATASDFGCLPVFITSGTDTRLPTNTSAGTLQLWGAQVEVTTANYPGPTSYMPTGAASFTRNADLASMTGANFTSWWNPNAGTFVTTVTPPGDYNQTGIVLEVTNGVSATEDHFIVKSNATSSAPGKRWVAATQHGGVQALLATAADGSATTAHLAYAYAANDFAMSADGGTVGTDASGTLPTGADLSIGLRITGGTSLWLNGHIAGLDYYNIRQSNAQMNILTAWLPSLSLDFTSGVLDPRVTYTGASLATIVDSTGRVTYKPNNLWNNSEALAANFVAGAPSASQYGGFSSSTTMPGGTISSAGLTASALQQVTYGNAGSGAIARNYAVSPNTNYIFSLVLATISGTFKLKLGANNTASWVGSTVSPEITVTTTPTRYYLAFTTGASWSASNIQVGAEGLTPYPLPALGSVYSSGWQLEAVTYETSPRTYNPTTSAAYYGPRFGYDPVTLLPLGLLIEEGRTNLILRSGDASNAAWSTFATGGGSAIITANSAVAPDGTTTAAKVVFNRGATTDQVVRYQALTGTVAVYAGSIYVKADGAGDVGKQVTVALDSNGTGVTFAIVTLTASWQRITAINTLAANAGCNLAVGYFNGQGTTQTGSVSVDIWGGQVELTTANYPGPTSYIPTTTVAVARVADVASITGANFSSWYNPLAGTFVVQATPPGNYDQLGAIVDASFDGSATFDHQILKINAAFNAVGKRYAGSTANVSNQAVIITGADSVGLPTKMAYAYATNDFGFANDGALAGTDTNGTLPSPITLSIGQRNSTIWWNGHIARLPYYPARIPNTPLTALTA